MNYFAHKTQWTLQYFLGESLTTSYEPARGIALEHAGAYLLCAAFRNPRRLSEIFDFAEDSPLKDEIAQIVALELDETTKKFTLHPVDVSSNLIPTYIWGCSPQTEEATLNWLKNPRRTMFCFPFNTVGPDLIMVLKLSDNSVVRILVQFKYKQDPLYTKDTTDALRTTDPYSFLKWTSTGGDKKARMRKRMRGALKMLGGESEARKAGDFGVLRVLAVYPEEPDLYAIIAEVQKDNHGHPIAKLRWERLKQENKIIGEALTSLKSMANQVSARRRELEGDLAG